MKKIFTLFINTFVLVFVGLYGCYPGNPR